MEARGVEQAVLHRDVAGVHLDGVAAQVDAVDDRAGPAHHQRLAVEADAVAEDRRRALQGTALIADRERRGTNSQR